MKKLFFFLILAFCNNLKAQKYLPNLVPPSPNASSILKFTEVPISYHKGTANINIPFFQTEYDGLNIEASIQYDTRGVKVSESASNIGTGWSLMSGGNISRQVRDRPDELPNGYLTFNHIKDFQTNSILRNNILSINNTYSQSDTSYDEYPDLYIFNFLGKTGKFIFDNFTKKPVLQSLDDLKIDVQFQSNTYTIEKIIITDEKGYKFIFGSSSSETAYDYISGISNQLINDFTNFYKDLEAGYRNSWQLLEIITPNNNVVKYKYAPENITQYIKSETLVNNKPALIIQRRILTQNVISEINYGLNKIVFNYDSSSREDLYGSKALKSVIAYDNNLNQIKKIELINSYVVGDPNTIPFSLKFTDPNSHKRLFLNNVKIWENNSANSSNYSFNYNNLLLPSKHSSSIDYWGYYNGIINKDNLLEDQNIRSVSSQYNEAGILKKITYPTGGSVEIEYENNQVMTPSYFKNLLVPNFTFDANYFHEVNEGIFKGSWFFNYSTNTYEKNITINVPPNLSVGYYSYLGDNCTNIETSDCLTKVRLNNLDTGESFIITNGISNFPANLVKPGNYKIVVTNSYFSPEDDLNFETNNFFVALTWKELNDENNFYNNFIAGGKRVKSIIYNSNNVITKRNFEYLIDNTVSSGKLIGLPDFFYRSKENNNIIFGTSSAAPLSSFNVGGDVGYSLVTEKVLDGNNNLKQSIQYYYTNYEDGGQFYMNYFHIADNIDWARGLNTQVIYKNNTGQIVKKIENQYSFYNETLSPYLNYRKYNNQLVSNTPQSNTQLVDNSLKEIPTHYFYSKNLVTIPIYRFGDYRDIYDNNQNSENPSIYRIAFFTGGKITLNKTITQDFLNGTSIATTSNFFYTNPLNYQLSKEEIIFPDGSQTSKNFSYAHEKTNSFLVDKNMVGIPLQTTTTKTTNGVTKTISVLETKYPISQTEANAKTSGLPLPYEIKNSDLLGVSQTEITYDKYDSKGNILQYTPKSGVPVTIIWGYNQTQPIAKIEGVTYDTLTSLVGSLVNDAITKSNADKDKATEDTLILALNSLRTNSNVVNYQITTYTYDPLIGVTSITPPSGIMERYYYDAANRLEKVIDVNGNILKEYKYNYKQ